MQVIKHGYMYDADKSNPTSYSCKCRRCGCEMEFTCDDLLYAGMEHYLGRTRAVFCLICPDCKATAYSTYGEMRIKE